ncbi:MAG: hypothetical protein HOV77_18450 [Hamadaea sp.]|uniref:hypothetical protein n=1 Tax=Hamadaea sp. TaxID=2024425 RepID=UPI0017947E8D|nr:hypothetical protein [Hamadaea sp.]NUT21156.1 hypothetical protein [Hamadaea sp.]
MYAWIWRHLPGPLWARISTSVVAVAGICALLWFFAFPWAEPLLPFDDVQVGEIVPGQDVIPYDTETNNPAPTHSPGPSATSVPSTTTAG